MGDPYCQTRWMQLRMHVKSHSLNLCSRFSAHDRNVTFIACLLHRKVRVCVCVEEREGKDGGEGIMVASVDRRGEAKCLQTHRPYMSPDSPHVACVPAGRQATPHATTLQPIKRPAQHGFPLATKFAWSSVTTLIKSKLQPYAINSGRVWLRFD